MLCLVFYCINDNDDDDDDDADDININNTVQAQHFATFWFGFSVWFFIMELNPLLDLRNMGFNIIENGLFRGGEHKLKSCTGNQNILDRFLVFIDKMVIFT